MSILSADDLPSDPAAAKALLRRRMRGARAMMAHAAGATAAGRLARRALPLIERLGRRPVAAYWPVRHEIDVRPLMEALAAAGHEVLLPVVPEDEGAPLLFRPWRPGLALVPGAHGIPVPPPELAPRRPRVVIVPLLAFDRRGHRLGQGGGHYDRTLAALRAHAPLIAVGAAFSGQEIDAVPAQPHDQPLDWIVTDRAVLGPFRPQA